MGLDVTEKNANFQIFIPIFIPKVKYLIDKYL